MIGNSHRGSECEHPSAEPFEQWRSALWSVHVSAADVFSIGGRLLAYDGPTPQVRRVAVVGSATAELVTRGIACAVLREGELARMYTGLHGSFVQEIVDPRSRLYEFAPESVVMVIDWRDFVTALPPNAEDRDVERAVQSKVELYERLWDRLRDRGIAVFMHLPQPPPARFRGIAERCVSGSPLRQFTAVCDALLARGRGIVHWVDVQSLAYAAGAQNWAPERFYFEGRLSFDPRHLPAYMRAFGAAWRAWLGRSKRALILDLDDTLWGGVLGDDGIEGIVLGPGTAAGEAYAAWNDYLTQLRARGVALAICSKNDRDLAAAALASPRAMLKFGDFAAFECSWDDKAAGIRRIAKTLNLPMESLVFADDNEAECDLVRRELPRVAVVALGRDPADFVHRLEREQWFDLDVYTAEDFGRASSYAARTDALEAVEPQTDLEGFLAGLEMRAEYRAPEHGEVPRVAQLERKTNQFNCAVRRYDERAVAAFCARPDAIVRVLHLRDKYADHGIVSSVIAVLEADVLRIESWVMSCRVFSRSVEHFVFGCLLREARELGASRIRIVYQATDRNHLCVRAFEELGCTRADDGCWEVAPDRVSAVRSHVAAAVFE